MSHANGAVKFKSDGLIMFFVYDGITDTNISTLYDTKEDLYENWRKSKISKCTCGKSEDVELMNDYGDGIFCQGKACRYCHAIVFPIYVDDMIEIEKDGVPEWSPF